MINYLLDTNLLLRLSDKISPDRVLAEEAIAKLLGNGDQLCITTQQAEAEIKLLQNKFQWLPDPPDVLTP